MSQERRGLDRIVELRVDTDAPPQLVGYAAIFGQRTTIAGMFHEQIDPGAFRDAVGEDDVRALFNHDPNFLLGRSAAGTLRLSEDATGLRYEIDMPDTQVGRDVLTSVKRGDIRGSSFAFDVVGDVWTNPTRSGELPVRTITKARLFDVSPVTFPAYEQTSVSARSQAEASTRPVDTMSVERSRWTLAQKG